MIAVFLYTLGNIMVWLETPVLVATNMVGNLPRSATSFGATYTTG